MECEKEGQSNCKSYRLKSLWWTARNGGLDLNRVWYSLTEIRAVMKASRSIQNYILMERVFRDRSCESSTAERNPTSKSMFSTRLHETPSNYQSAKSGRCAVLFIHSKTMMTLKMELSLLQLLRQDMLLLIHSCVSRDNLDRLRRIDRLTAKWQWTLNRFLASMISDLDHVYRHQRLPY